ncbi:MULTISPECIES: methyltransferase domain-containing protein [Thermomonosporaceae]|uniref:methyltransferase domain-containing protein n=1 Tax=Thermomonosporaceae TaxID=2012 RepID=UPI00255B1752|nr:MULTISPECIES: methyltransferase domain-containing protein [Thermomonosporaceae]MDL4776695.1 methyltransferase domain-containing protein [Actinomadura xylanilytica]
MTGSPRAAEAGADVFEGRVDAWDTWRAAPWNRLRYRLVEQTLDRGFGRAGAGCRVLDVGGGDGGDGLGLAERGHRVTILDHSPALLDRAAARAEAAGLAGRVRTVRADLDTMPALDLTGPGGEAPGGFDLVLCHNVLHYRADVAGTIGLLVRMVGPGGTLSVMAPNPAMDVLSRAVRLADPAGALTLIDAPTLRSETFEHDMWRLEPGSVEAALASAGCPVRHRYGIRCVMDLITDDARKADPAFSAAVERLELELCDREPYVRTARFWQLLAVRDGGPGAVPPGPPVT